MEPAKQARVERRLAAILAADVAGYSRLMGTDEEGTVRRLKAMRAGLIDPTISEHHGRIVHTTGDGLLVEFHSVVDAMRCAIEWQSGMTQRNAGDPADPASIGALGSISATSSSTMTTFTATGSTSPRGSKPWPSPAASASRTRC